MITSHLVCNFDGHRKIHETGLASDQASQMLPTALLCRKRQLTCPLLTISRKWHNHFPVQFHLYVYALTRIKQEMTDGHSNETSRSLHHKK